MSKDDFPYIDLGLLNQEQKVAEPGIVLWTGAKGVVARDPAAAPPERAPPTPEVDWSLMRKLNPVNVLLPAVREWAHSLRPDVVPRALLAQFPRIANLLCRDWCDPDTFRASLYDLLVDRRGGRRGFSVEVRTDLLRLRVYYDTLSPVGAAPNR